MVDIKRINNFSLINNSILNFSAISLGKLLYGFYTVSIGLLMVPMIETFNITLRTQSIIFPFNNFGQMVGMLLVGFIVSRLGNKIIHIILLILLGLSALLFTFISTYFLFLLLFLFMGLFSSSINMVVDATISDIFLKNKGFYLNISHIFFGFGGLLSPIVYNLVFAVTKDFKQFYFILFILAFFVLLLIIAVKYPETEIKNIRFNVIGKLLRNKRFLLLCIYIVISAGTMYSVSGWLPTLFQKDLGLTQVLSNYLLSLFWLAIIIGRLIVALLCRKYKEIKILSWMNVSIAILLIIPFFLNSPIFIMAIYFLLGLSMGGFFPLVVSISSDVYPQYSASRISLVFVSSVIGMLITPTVIGLFADIFVIYRIISFTAVFFIVYSYIFFKKY